MKRLFDIEVTKWVAILKHLNNIKLEPPVQIRRVIKIGKSDAHNDVCQSNNFGNSIWI